MRPTAIQQLPPPSSLREGVLESLAGAIVSGELEPGELVSVPALAARFDVSATPVREAMLELEQRGFVTSVRNKGFRVTQVSQSDLRDIIHIRQMLEAPAFRELAVLSPAIDIAPWRELAGQISEHAAQGEITGFIQVDRDFHLGLIGLLGNSRLVRIVRDLRAQTRMVNLVGMTGTAELAQSAREHHLILDLIEKRDGDGVDLLVRSHLEHIVHWWAGARPST